MVDNLYRFREYLKLHNVYFSFIGPFSQVLMEDIIEVVLHHHERFSKPFFVR